MAAANMAREEESRIMKEKEKEEKCKAFYQQFKAWLLNQTPSEPIANIDFDRS